MNTLITSFSLLKTNDGYRAVLVDTGTDLLINLKRTPARVVYHSTSLRFILEPFISIDPDGNVHPIAVSGSLHLLIDGRPISLLDWQVEGGKYFTVRTLMFDPNTGTERTLQIIHQELR